MAFSNLAAIAIIVTTAATLHAHGITNIQTSSQAAEALRPVAGRFAFSVFTLGILGTGLLAVPVLAGSAAYAIGEARKWPTGLARQPLQAKAFYATLATATLVGVALNFTSFDPIQALFWSAVINGVVAAPVMVLMMLLTANTKIVGQFTVTGILYGMAGDRRHGRCGRWDALQQHVAKLAGAIRLYPVRHDRKCHPPASLSYFLGKCGRLGQAIEKRALRRVVNLRRVSREFRIETGILVSLIPKRQAYGRSYLATSALFLAPKKNQQNYNWQRYTHQPKQRAAS